jgi:hypothetical protein
MVGVEYNGLTLEGAATEHLQQQAWVAPFAEALTAEPAWCSESECLDQSGGAEGREGFRETLRECSCSHQVPWGDRVPLQLCRSSCSYELTATAWGHEASDTSAHPAIQLECCRVQQPHQGPHPGSLTAIGCTWMHCIPWGPQPCILVPALQPVSIAKECTPHTHCTSDDIRQTWGSRAVYVCLPAWPTHPLVLLCGACRWPRL